MRNSLTVTDLTQMGGERVCVAGYLPDGACVRPVLRFGGLTRDWLCRGNQATICPFSVIEFEFGSIIKNGSKPHTEDSIIHSPNYVFKGLLNIQQRLELLSSTDDKTIDRIFGAKIYSGPDWYIRTGEGDRSIGTISDPKIAKTHYDNKDNKFEYRIAFTDRSGSNYNLAVTDLTFRYFLDYMHFIENLDPQIISQMITEKLKSCQLFLRIGLARGWDKYPDRCYLQINGIYSFPDYLNGRTFKDLELPEGVLEKRNRLMILNSSHIRHVDVKEMETIALQKPSLKDLKSLRDNMGSIKDQIASKYNESDIADMESQISSLQEQIQAKKTQLGITDLENEISQLENAYNILLKDTCQRISAWQPDRFSKYDLYEADGLKLIRRSRTVREIRASELFEKFPFLAPKIAKCTLKDASRYLSDSELNEFCDRKISYSYEVI